MKRSHLALAVAAAALAISASGPAYAADAVDTAAAPAAKTEVVTAAVANALTIDRVAFVPAPRLTYAVLYTTTSPSALVFGTATRSPSSIA